MMSKLSALESLLSKVRLITEDENGECYWKQASLQEFREQATILWHKGMTEEEILNMLETLWYAVERNHGH